MPQKVVLITRTLPTLAERLLRDGGCDVRALNCDLAPERAALLAAVKGVDAILCVLGDRVDRELLDAAGPSLRIVANYAVGFDNVDLPACRERGVRVTNTPDVLTDATADLAWTLILGASRRVVEGDRLVREGRWRGWYPTELLGLQLRGATLGIVGAGRIGTATALRSAGFGMSVVYCHPRNQPEVETRLGARRVELDELLRSSNVVSLHTPMRPENLHLLDRRRLALLQDGAVLVNTARGALIDESALVDELRSGRIRAGLDVYEREPQLAPGLVDLPNVVLLPHLGSATTTARESMARMAAENVLSVLRGDAPMNAVQ